MNSKDEDIRKFLGIILICKLWTAHYSLTLAFTSKSLY